MGKAEIVFNEKVARGENPGPKDYGELIERQEPSAKDLWEAKAYLLKDSQARWPPDDRRNHANSLKLEQDTQGIWRVCSRLNADRKRRNEYFPVYLNRHAPIVALLIKYYHEKNSHGQASEVLADIRNEYWIPSLRRKFHHTIVVDPKTRCITCLRKIAKPYVTPRNTVLKYHKMEFTDPFTATGTDYFGPITYFPTRAGREITLANRRRGGRSKEAKIEMTMQAYVCIFTCLATRNIHLELATDLSAEQFVHVLRRFMALKRQPKIILSDNAKYFVAAAKALRDFVVDPPIEWTFTRPKCPWEGGAYERMIGVTKTLM